MATPRPDIVGDLPMCSKLCSHYRPGESNYQPPRCDVTADDWPRICWPEIKRLVREAQEPRRRHPMGIPEGVPAPDTVAMGVLVVVLVVLMTAAFSWPMGGGK